MLRKNISICVILALLLPVGVTADDLTKMIQEELAALGYDTGNVEGEFSTETAIAISQFQAENGLEVTGEASPQLAGIIQAKRSDKDKPAAAAQPAAAPSMVPAAAGMGAMPELTPEQRQALEQSGMSGMFDKMMGGMTTGQPGFLSEPDKNVGPSDTYSFSHRVTMRITNARGTAEPVFYVQPGAPYYARQQTKNGVTQILVYDSDRNMAVLYAEKDGDKRTLHDRINIETKALLIGAYRDAPQEAPVKSLGTKSILGYPSRGYEISTLAGTTEIWVTDEAPASLFSTMFRNRPNSKGEPPLDENSMILELNFTSARTPEDNYRMECTELQSDALTLKTSDYQSS